MVEIEGQVGEIPMAIGPGGVFRQAPTGSAVSTPVHGKRFLSNYHNHTFHAANQGPQAVTLTGNATYTGLALYNPAGSGVLAEVAEDSFLMTTAPGGGSFIAVFMFTGAPSAFTTQVGTYPGKPGASQALSITAANGSKCNAYSALTLVVAPGAANAPIVRGLSGVLATGSSGTMPVIKDETSGSIILQPGTGVAFVGLITAPSGIGAFTWEEYPTQLFP